MLVHRGRSDREGGRRGLSTEQGGSRRGSEAGARNAHIEKPSIPPSRSETGTMVVPDL